MVVLNTLNLDGFKTAVCLYHPLIYNHFVKDLDDVFVVYISVEYIMGVVLDFKMDQITYSNCISNRLVYCNLYMYPSDIGNNTANWDNQVTISNWCCFMLFVYDRS